MLQEAYQSYMDSGVYMLLITIAIAFIVQFSFEHIFKGLLKKTKTEADDKIIACLKSPVFWSVFLSGTYLYVQNTRIENTSIETLQFVLVSVGIILWTIAFMRIAYVLLEEIGERHEDGKTLSDAVPFLKNVTALAILTIAAGSLLTIWGIDIAPLLASAGVLGIAVAFAAKDTISNLFGGVSIFLDKPYKVGDFVIVNKDYRGEVIGIGMRSTKIKTRDNILISVPNAVMITNAVINETGINPNLRIRIPLGVSYQSDLKSIEKLLVEIAVKSKLFVIKPKPRVRYRKFEDSQITLEFMGTVKSPIDKGRTTHKIIMLLHSNLTKEHVEFPFPQMDVHLKGNTHLQSLDTKQI